MRSPWLNIHQSLPITATHYEPYATVDGMGDEGPVAMVISEPCGHLFYKIFNTICKTRRGPTTNTHLFKWSQSHCDGISDEEKVDVCEKGFPNQ